MDHRRDLSRALHILVVDDDLAILKETCERLASEGHRASAFSRAVGVRQVIAELQPDVVLIDVLMPDLSRRSLQELLVHCAAGGAPMVILHSRVAERTLCALANIDGSAGVIRKTESPLAFVLAFNAIVERVRSPASWRSLGVGFAASGTHRVGDEADENADTMNTGGGRGAC